MTAVDLGIARRRASRQVMVGHVPVGGGAPVSVQSMTTTPTTDVDATLQQIAELTAAGCEIVRVAVPSQDDADALPAIAAKSRIPVIADIHFQPRYVFAAIAAIDAGCAAARVNPGNIRKFDDKVRQIAHAAAAAGVPIRIGVNAGSLDQRVLARHGRATPEALVESARDLDARIAPRREREIADGCALDASPLQTNGPRPGECSRGMLPLRGARVPRRQDLGQASRPAGGGRGVPPVGPALRLPLAPRCHGGRATDPGHRQVRRRLRHLARRGDRRHHPRLAVRPTRGGDQGRQPDPLLARPAPRRLEIVSCPSCGRAQVDVYKLTAQVTAAFDGFPFPLRVAVMGCVVNGPGESREADLGVSAGNGKGQIFVRGEVVRTVPESQIVEALLEEALERDWSEPGRR